MSAIPGGAYFDSRSGILYRRSLLAERRRSCRQDAARRSATGRRTVEKHDLSCELRALGSTGSAPRARSATVLSRASLRLRIVSDSWLAEVPP
jgi:hypothetical protein